MIAWLSILACTGATVEPPPEPLPEATTEEAPAPEPAADPGAEPLVLAPTCVAEDRVERTPTWLQQQARVIPHRDAAGVMDGVRLAGVRQGSVADDGGLKNGDVVQGVNGHDFGSIEAMAAAFDDLIDDPVYEIRLVRQGRAGVLTLSVGGCDQRPGL